jgi:gamma-glutamyltranspeptidase/glutathione hydrolase
MVGGRRVMTSNMNPTIATVDGKVRFTVGASGANHIVPAIFCIAGFMLDHGLDVETAAHAPRIDATGREDVQVDLHMPDDVVAALRRRFKLTFAERTVLPKQFASPSAISRDPDSGQVAGVADVYSPSAMAFAGERG